MNNLIEVKNLSVKFNGHTVLEGIDFNVREQEILAVIGPNGSGKSTLVRAILGLIPYQSGEIRRPKMKTGYVPQSLDFDRTFPLSVEDLFLMKMTKAKFWFRDKAVGAEIKKCLADTGAEKLSDELVGNLSGGELQRVLIALALIDQPKLLVLDEPLAGVDVSGEESIQDLIERLHERFKLTIIMVSHDLDVVYRHASSVICVNRRLVCDGAPGTVLTAANLEKLYGPVKGYYHKHD